MTGFKASSPQYGEIGVYVNLNWAAYADENVTASSDGGDVIYAKKRAGLEGDMTLPRDKALAAGVTVDNTSDKDEFYIRLTLDTLANGAYTVTGLAKNTYYCFYLFAYIGAKYNITYQSALLAKANTKTGISRYATLNIYGHYVIETADHDGPTTANYYWDFNWSGEKPEFDHTSNTDRFLFCRHQLQKFSPTVTKKISIVLDRTRNYFFTQTWEAWEDDFGELYDDYLGKVTANFTYTSATDTWTCSWSSTCGASGISYITAGERTGKPNGSKDDGLRWELHNTDEGEIEFHWDWGWDE